MTCAVPGLQGVVFLFWAHTYVTQMPSLYCRSECRELWSVPGLMEWFISLLIVESTSTLHRSLLLIADLSVENMVSSWAEWFIICIETTSTLHRYLLLIAGLSVENFVPFLDYKERAQQWKWIGAGRDSNSQLSPLFRHWLKHKNTTPVDGLSSSQGSPPPVRT